MARSLNKVQLIGSLGKDPDSHYTASGTMVVNFSVATNREWKGQDGQKQEATEWTRIVAWDKLGEICNQYLRKGSKVYVEGRLQTRSFVDKDGNERYITEVVITDMVMLGESKGSASRTEEPSEEVFDEEPLPPRRAPATAQAPATPARRPVAAPPRNRPAPVESDDEIPF